MQLITHEQQQFLAEHGWKAVEGLLWGAAMAGIRKTWKSVKSVVPDMKRELRHEWNADINQAISVHNQSKVAHSALFAAFRPKAHGD